jgi:hypothetical protein
MYDSGKGRWFAPDPARQYWSGYVGMGNNPVSLVDPDGRCTWRNSSGETKYFEAGTEPGSDWTYVGSDFQYADINVSPQYTAHERTMMNPVVNNIHAGTNQASIYIAPILLGIGSFGTASTAVSIAKRAAFMYRMYSRAEAGKTSAKLVGKEVSNTATRMGRDGGAVEVSFKDGSKLDINAARVKEWVPNPHPNAPAGTLQKVKFDNFLPGFKRLQTNPNAR